MEVAGDQTELVTIAILLKTVGAVAQGRVTAIGAVVGAAPTPSWSSIQETSTADVWLSTTSAVTSTPAALQALTMSSSSCRLPMRELNWLLTGWYTVFHSRPVTDSWGGMTCTYLTPEGPYTFLHSRATVFHDCWNASTVTSVAAGVAVSADACTAMPGAIHRARSMASARVALNVRSMAVGRTMPD
ncbi:MAG: hypothetical protein UHD09_09420 [Bifidobacterium sp.]|nr:hypothetical protein [Bifidobacterium sp.]